MRLSFILLFFLPTLCLAEDKKVIGALLPLSNVMAESGDSIRNGITLALEENPEKAKSFDFKFEDTRFLSTSTVDAYRSLIQTKKPEAVIIFGSTPSISVSELAEKDGIPLLSISTSDKVQSGKKFVFRHMVNTKPAGEVLIRVLKERKISKIAIVATTTDGMIAFREAFNSLYSGEITGSEEVAAGDLDLRSLALNLIRKKPEAIYVLLIPPQASQFAKAVRGLGYKGLLFGANQLDNSVELMASEGAFENLVLVKEGDSSTQEFQEKYQKRFGKRAENFAANGYDYAKMILNSGENLVEYLNSLKDFKGALGTYSVLENHSFSIPAGAYTVKNGAFTPL